MLAVGLLFMPFITYQFVSIVLNATVGPSYLYFSSNAPNIQLTYWYIFMIWFYPNILISYLALCVIYTYYYA